MTRVIGRNKPAGNITRGTTAPNRLRRIDRWLIDRECTRLRSVAVPLVVDLGYGASPVTAGEMRDRLQKHVRADLQVVGIEIDPVRVAEAKSLTDQTLTFVHGGFELPTAHPPALVRAANVLRQYQESDVWPAWQRMAQNMQPGALLIDATCDEIGRLASWIAVRVAEGGKPVPETFTISLHVGALEVPSDVAARLPKSLIHRNVPGERIHAVLAKLDDAWVRTASHATFGARAHWVAAIEYAVAHGLTTLDDRARWRLGELTLPFAEVAPAGMAVA